MSRFGCLRALKGWGRSFATPEGARLPSARVFALGPVRLLVALGALLLSPAGARAANDVEVGSGWEDMGAIDGGPTRHLEWLPSIQGSRKDVPFLIGWRHTGESRVYWAPYARLNLTNFWSIAGSGNLLGVTLAPAGLGVYLTRPPDEFDAAGRTGRWFAAVEINFGAVEVGGNITPDAPANPAVPDPDAYRTALRNDVQNRGGVQSSTFVTQFYPFGSYHYVLVTTPVQIRAWKMLTPHDGIGFFVEGFPLMLEWNLAPGSTKTPAYGYSVVAGVSLMVF